MARLEFRNQEIMLDPTKRDNASLIRCEDEEYLQMDIEEA
jgi:hypothetical protein